MQTDVESFGDPRLELPNGLDRRVRGDGGRFRGGGHVASVAGAETPGPERHSFLFVSTTVSFDIQYTFHPLITFIKPPPVPTPFAVEICTPFF